MTSPGDLTGMIVRMVTPRDTRVNKNSSEKLLPTNTEVFKPAVLDISLQVAKTEHSGEVFYFLMPNNKLRRIQDWLQASPSM